MQLDLDVPLKKGLGKIQVNGDVTLEDNELIPKVGEFELTDIRGILHFSQDGISADKVDARMLDQPVLVSVYRQGKEGASQTVVDIEGKLKLISRLRDSGFFIAPYFKGESDWQSLP